MPSHRVHLYIDRLYFGREYPRIHKAIDFPVKFYGPRHRILFHDNSWAIGIAAKEYPGDPNAIRSAILHINYDRICSNDPEYKNYLEKLAKKNENQRRKINRKNTEHIRKQVKQLKKTIKRYERSQKKKNKAIEKKQKAEWNRIIKSWKIKKVKKKRKTKSSFKF